MLEALIPNVMAFEDGAFGRNILISFSSVIWIFASASPWPNQEKARWQENLSDTAWGGQPPGAQRIVDQAK